MKNQCKCCLSSNNLKELTEDYVDLILSCFSIEVSITCSFGTFSNFICESCVLKITESSAFRSQILISLTTLKEYYSPKTTDQSNDVKFDSQLSVKEEILSDCDEAHDYNHSSQSIKTNETSYEEDNLSVMKNQEDEPTEKLLEQKWPFEGKKLIVLSNKLKDEPNVRPIEQIFLLETNTIEQSIDSSIKPKEEPNHQIDKKDESLKNILNYTLPTNKMICDDFIMHNSTTENNNFLSNDFSVLPKVEPNFNISNALKKNSSFISNKKDNLKSHVKIKMYKKVPFTLDKTTRTCKLCNGTYKSYELLISHLATHFPNYICDICKKPFLERQNLIKHMKTHKNEIPCTKCDQRIKLAFVKRHMESHSDSLEILECSQCSKSFLNKARFLEHTKGAHSDLNYKCEICNKNYINKSSLSSHMKKIHLKIFKNSCSICDKKFLLECQLKEHLQKHSGEKNYECDICHKKFFLAKILKAHVNNFHMKNKTHVCDVCGKSFFDRQNFRIHSYTHSDQRNFECEICHKKYKRKSHLTDHMHSHGKRRFKCRRCDSKFTYKINLIQHMKNVHKETVRAESVVAIRSNPNSGSDSNSESNIAST